MQDIKKRIAVIVMALAGIFLAGVGGYMLIEHWNFLDALYMTVITLASVGYGETHPLTDTGRIFTIILIFGGMGLMAFIFSSITALMIEGALKDAFRKFWMEYKMDKMKNHYLICGATHTGLSIAHELHKTGRPFIIIVLSEAEVKKFVDAGYCVVAGDAATDETLIKSNIHEAKGIFCTLKNDKDNAFIAITARGLNRELRIITVQNAEDTAMRDKLIRSGADIVISPFHIGGLRMASEMIRPSTAQFLDKMMRDGKNFRFEDITIGENAAGKPLSVFKGGEGGVALVVAVKHTSGHNYELNPVNSKLLNKGDIMVALGSPNEIAALRQIAS